MHLLSKKLLSKQISAGLGSFIYTSLFTYQQKKNYREQLTISPCCHDRLVCICFCACICLLPRIFYLEYCHLCAEHLPAFRWNIEDIVWNFGCMIYGFVNFPGHVQSFTCWYGIPIFVWWFCISLVYDAIEFFFMVRISEIYRTLLVRHFSLS